MCGIGAIYALDRRRPLRADALLDVIEERIAHRGPDGRGRWISPDSSTALVHRRLAIIDLVGGAQPMRGPSGAVVSYNGEIYNYRELRAEVGQVVDNSDTAVLLAAYERWGDACVEHLRGMFAFALYDPATDRLVCARDRFGIKPLYYAVVDGVVLVASEVKALVPFLPEVEIDTEALADYFTLQLVLGDATLVKGVRQVPPGHRLVVDANGLHLERYWSLRFDIDYQHTARYFEDHLEQLLLDSASVHLRSDVPVAAYISGGIDSSLVAALAVKSGADLVAFHGHFEEGPAFDESRHARAVAEHLGVDLRDHVITEAAALEALPRAVYAMDYPEAGPGLLPQFVLAQHVAETHKVVLGGQGGDEMFGGYARYVLAYFEQCIAAAIDGTAVSGHGHFVATYETILPNLANLRGYKPMMRTFFASGMFGPKDRRYFDLIDRSRDYGDGEVRWGELGDHGGFERFQTVFRGLAGSSESYFDSMTNFDFHTLLPALLHVEDRVSMAHGLESRVPCSTIRSPSSRPPCPPT